MQLDTHTLKYLDEIIQGYIIDTIINRCIFTCNCRH